jgi:type VI secretion system protein ImpK
MRYSLQYPSNWELSEARARAVGEILATYTGQEAILAVGRADSDPVASNDTEEGRKANRRTEILVLTDPTERLDAVKIAPTLRDNGTGNQAAPEAGGVSP